MTQARAGLFFGARIPSDAARSILAELASAFEAAGWRGVDARDFHVTLFFLGAVPVGKIAELGAAARAALSAEPSFDARIDTLAAFPDRGTPRVAWVGGAELSARTLALHARLCEVASRLGLVQAEQAAPQPWTAHVTIARPRTGRRGRWPRHLPVGPWPTVRIDEVGLFETHPGTDEGRYRVLERIPLIRPPA